MPDEVKEPQNDEIPAAEEEVEALTQDEIDAILGGGSERRRLIIFAATGAIALAVVAWLFFAGGASYFVQMFTDRDTLNVVNSSADVAAASDSSQAADSEAVTAGLPGGDDAAANPASSVDPVEALAVTDSLIPTEELDEFFMLLNAEVSDTESAKLDEETFYALLFEPMLPVKMPPPRRSPTNWGLGRLFPDSVQWSTADSATAAAVIDSLKAELASVRRALEAAENKAQIKGEAKIDAARSDSAQAAEIKRLAKIVDNMSAGAAARMLVGMETNQIEEVLFRIKPRQAAKILAELPPATTTELAGRVIRQRKGL